MIKKQFAVYVSDRFVILKLGGVVRRVLIAEDLFIYLLCMFIFILLLKKHLLLQMTTGYMI